MYTIKQLEDKTNTVIEILDFKFFSFSVCLSIRIETGRYYFK